MRIRIPGPPAVRTSVVAGNIRVHALVDAVAAPGSLVVDVGAHTGYNTVYAAARVGPRGRVIAIEPAPDNLAVLVDNLSANRLENVVVQPVAAGRVHETRELFVRGEASAVNSLYPESCYGAVTGVTRVRVAPLDDLVDGRPTLVKIDVEGAELDVLAGMGRMLRDPAVRLVVEWHPMLQQLAGYPPTALPQLLLEAGFTLDAVSHVGTTRLASGVVAEFARRLLSRRSRPVELLARR